MQSTERSLSWLTRAGLALALLLSACSQTGHLVVVSVQATVAIPTAATLHVVATAGGRSHPYDIPLSPAGIPPVRSFGITVPPSVKGSFAVTVQALDAQGQMLGQAHGEVALPSSGRVDLELDLTSGGQVTDGGVMGDDMVMPSVALATTAKSFMVRQGNSVAVPLTVTRAPGVDGDVVVTVDGLPGGVAPQALTIPAGQTKGALSLIASGQAGQGGPNPLSITGTMGSATAKLAIDLYVAGAPGTLDQSYNSTGIVAIDNPTKSYDVCQALALGPGGLPVITGQTRTYSAANGFGTEHAFAARTTNLGLLDSAFGTNGRKIVTSPDDSSANGVVVQSDGKVVLVGHGAITSGDNDVLFVRLNTDGTPDGTFGTAGVSAVDLGTVGDQGWAVTVQPDGKLVAVASSTGASFVVRVGADGTPDPDFGNKGIATLPKFGSSGNDSLVAILLQADGKIVLGGTVTNQNSDAVVARVTDKGALDTTFGTNGRTIVNGTYNGNDLIAALAAAPDGSIVAGGTSQISTGAALVDRFAAYHFSKDGVPDTAFGAYNYAGIVAFGDKDDGYGVAVQPSDGKIVLSGTVSHGSNKVNAITRLDSRGNLDQTFGTQGKLEVDVNPTDFDGAYQVALDPGGRILVAGFVGVDMATTYDCTLLRIWP